jgi:hypothetical protein
MEGTIPTVLGLMSSLNGLDLCTFLVVCDRRLLLSCLILEQFNSISSPLNRSYTVVCCVVAIHTCDVCLKTVASIQLTGSIPSEIGLLENLVDLPLCKFVFLRRVQYLWPPFSSNTRSHRGSSIKSYSDGNLLTGKAPTELGSLQILNRFSLGTFFC